MNEYIREHWDQQAETHGAAYSASWGDLFAIQLEVATIGQFIHEGDRVLDVGCANGFSMLQHLDKKPASLTGVDFSEGMIRAAWQNAEKVQAGQAPVHFEAGDIRKLRFADRSFDLVYTTRTLINLPTWEEQKGAILECIRVCRDGGTVVLSEAFWEPLALLNALRLVKALPPLVEHDFNRYLKKSLLEEFLSARALEFEAVDFSSVYYLGTRFLRELVVDSKTQVDFKKAAFDNPFNELFYQIEKDYSGGGFGIQQAYVIHR
jgi:ubiquinone/menaquinone biosynthesis C-methylase UbiE